MNDKSNNKSSKNSAEILKAFTEFIYTPDINIDRAGLHTPPIKKRRKDKKMSDKLYRVIVKKTKSVQPNETYWEKTCIYCGYDLREARSRYYEEELQDHGGVYGSPARVTIMQIIEPGRDEEDLKSDTVTEVRKSHIMA